MSKSLSGSAITVSLYRGDHPDDAAPAAPLATGRAEESDLSTTPQWVTIRFETPVEVMAGMQLFFLIMPDDMEGGDAGWNNYGATNGNAYGGGQLFTRSGWQWNENGYGYGAHVLDDLAFQVIAS